MITGYPSLPLSGGQGKALIPRRKGDESTVNGRGSWCEGPQPKAMPRPHGGRLVPGLEFCAELLWRLPFILNSPWFVLLFFLIIQRVHTLCRTLCTYSLFPFRKHLQGEFLRMVT